MKTVFSVGSAPRLYNEDARPAVKIIENVSLSWQSGCEEKTLRVL
jgi:hypothetical protein